MTEATSRFFETSDDVRLHYLEAGSGPTIVLVPGWTAPALIWRRQLDLVREGFRVVLFDPRSQGESEIPRTGNEPNRRAQDLHELLIHLGTDPVVLVGWSMGATEILGRIQEHGTAGLAAIVLVDTVVVHPEWMSQYVRQLTQELHADRRAATEKYIRGMFRGVPDESEVQWLIEESLSTPVWAAIELMEGFLAQPDWRPVLSKIDRPLLYLIQDTIVRQVDLLKSHAPHAQVEILEGAGHALFVESPERFNAALLRFIDDLPGNFIPQKLPGTVPRQLASD